jgi:hypothetical protein
MIRRLILFVVSLGCFALSISGAVSMMVPPTEDRLGKLEWQSTESRLDTERRMTRLETWQSETEWEIHGTLAGVGALILERAFSRRARSRAA